MTQMHHVCNWHQVSMSKSGSVGHANHQNHFGARNKRCTYHRFHFCTFFSQGIHKKITKFYKSLRTVQNMHSKIVLPNNIWHLSKILAKLWHHTQHMLLRPLSCIYESSKSFCRSWLCCLFSTSPFLTTIVALLGLPIMLFLVQEITAATTTLIAIIVEAYKKFVLVSLIQTG